MPCRAFLAQLREAHDTLDDLGADIVAIGPTADWQARRLAEDGVPFPLLLDPDRRFVHAVGLGRMRWRQWLSPTWARNYFGAARTAGQGMVSARNATRLPGVVIVDRGGTLRWIHRGSTLGDYPTVDEVIAAVRRLAAGGEGDH